MTYYDSFSEFAETEHDLKIIMEEATRVAVMLCKNDEEGRR